MNPESISIMERSRNGQQALYAFDINAWKDHPEYHSIRVEPKPGYQQA